MDEYEEDVSHDEAMWMVATERERCLNVVNSWRNFYYSSGNLMDKGPREAILEWLNIIHKEIKRVRND